MIGLRPAQFFEGFKWPVCNKTLFYTHLGQLGLPQFNVSNIYCDYVVGPCHHGMARPQVADRGMASDEGSCE